LHYNKTIALWAAFILLTAEHILISNNDVRAEPYLTGLVIGAIFHFSKAISKQFSWHLVWACLFTGCAAMTKGPFYIVVIGVAVGGHLLVTKNWKAIFHWRWMVAAALVVLFIIPELYSLWYQFDNHPEKIVNGKAGVSGIRFFLWEGQLSRIADTGMLKEKKDHFFYLHTLLWAFMPWSLLMAAGIFQRFKKNGAGIAKEWYTLTGSLATIVLFSISRFQLPYYTNTIFPLLAIITANYLYSVKEKAAGIFSILQTVIAILLLVVPVLLQVFYSPQLPSYFVLVIILAILALFVALPRWHTQSKMMTAFCRAGISILLLNFYLNQVFYPDLLKYQSSSAAAFIHNKEYAGSPSVYVGLYASAYEFYSRDTLIQCSTNPAPSTGAALAGTWYISEEELGQLVSHRTTYEILQVLPHFNVSQLSLKFINKKTRQAQLTNRYLVRIK
jgi:4-amino-4-deoxy-L-arabinose transferase-like glycosyltransferase